MADASQQVVAAQEKVSPRDISPATNLGYSTGSNIHERKQRESVALSMVDYSIMEPEEKDIFIEKLKRQNLLAKTKIQELENANADFWKTIQTQQELLESMDRKMEEQENVLKAEKQNLRLKKNNTIRKLKHLLDKERGQKVPDKPQSPIYDSDFDKNEFENLRLENNKLKEETQRLSNLVFATSQKSLTNNENYFLTDHKMEIKPLTSTGRISLVDQRQGICSIIVVTAIIALIVTCSILHDAIQSDPSPESLTSQLSGLGGRQLKGE